MEPSEANPSNKLSGNRIASLDEERVQSTLLRSSPEVPMLLQNSSPRLRSSSDASSHLPPHDEVVGKAINSTSNTREVVINYRDSDDEDDLKKKLTTQP